MGEKIVTSARVRNYHIDSYGHVNNAQYLVLLEEARTQFLERVGFPLEELQRQGYQIVINEIHLRLKRPARHGDHLEIHNWFPELRRVRVTWRQEIVNAKSGELIATALVSGGFLKEGRVVPIPEPVYRVMSGYYVPGEKER
ncbi:MAG: thioesterase family protein [Syntrophomonadaceae bacterium]|nr:thioesterase family protein [Syntrophomonadaceae bacterium]